MTIERRAITAAPELRSNGSAKVASGYAARFNVEAQIGSWFREKIAPGAFSDSLSGDIRALVDHDTGRVIGRSTAGTLRLDEDDTGLAIEIDLPDTSDGRDLAVQLERGDISGMSFGFKVPIGGDSWDIVDDVDVRTIHKAQLIEVSVVAFPAYDDASIALRSRDAARSEQQNHPAKRRIDARRAAMELKFRGI